jgi:nitrite reductase (NADH) large subunit
MGGEGSEQILLRDPAMGVYRKLVVRDDRLAGAVLFGDVTDGAWYLDLIRSGESVAAFRDDLMFGRPATMREAA